MKFYFLSRSKIQLTSDLIVILAGGSLHDDRQRPYVILHNVICYHHTDQILAAYNSRVLRSYTATFRTFEIKRVFVRKQKIPRVFIGQIFGRHESQVRQTQYTRDVRIIDGVVTAVTVDFERENSSHVRMMYYTVLPHRSFNLASQISGGIYEFFITTTCILLTTGLIRLKVRCYF